MTRTRRLLLVLLVLLVAASSTPAQEVPFDRLATVLEAVRPSAVVVEYHLRHDRGEAPRSIRGPNVEATIDDDGATFVREERPCERVGFLVGDRRVVTMDPMIHPRFVERVVVRQGKNSTPARVVAFTKSKHGLVLEIEKVLRGTSPLRFEASRPRPWFTVDAGLGENKLYLTVGSLWPRLSAVGGGEPLLLLSPMTVVVDAGGIPVGHSLGHASPVDGPWRGSPLLRPAVTAEEMDRALADLEGRVARGVLRVRLNFRSPKADAGSSFRWRSDDAETATEMDVPGLLLSEGRVLVLASLEPKDTFRLEKIAVSAVGGDPVEATFESSLRYDGAFLARLATPLDGAVALSPKPIEAHDGRLLLAADVRIEGAARTVFVQRCGFGSLQVGWRRRLRPSLYGASGALFVFDLEGNLVGLPLSERERIAGGNRWGGRGSWTLMGASTLRQVLEDPELRVDPANVPGMEDAERKLAWLGVILQPLDKDLARANGVSHLTGDGESGAIVSFVYPGSPAAEAGIEVGSVLLRIQAEGHPTPIDVHGGSGSFGFELPPGMPAELRRRLGARSGYTPWPSVDGDFATLLTDLGAGTKCVMELWGGSAVERKPFVVVIGPPKYEVAPRVKSKALDLTVRDLTFEVRHYFQMKPEDPGVIVSKVEEGGKGAVAGIQPYEMITHVDDAPVRTVGEFEAAIRGGGEKRFTVRFKMQTRLVKILLPESGGEEEKTEGD